MKAERTVQTMKTQHGPDSRSASPFVINARYQAHRVTGVQRYAHEIVNRLEGAPELLAPSKGRGAMGHLWEQIVLPRLAGGRLLWSPCGGGPIAYSRQVVTIHDLFPIEHPEWYSAPYARWYKLMFEQLAAKAVHLIAVSGYTRDRIVQVLRRDPSEITVVHNGPSSTTRLTSALEASKTCAALALPTRRYILSLSSLESRKNLPTILAAWREAQRHLPDNVWLVLAGQQPDASVFGKQKLEAIPARVHFTGYVAEEHLAGLYSGASLFLFPSLAEGFGLPLLEAMSCGVRSITSNNSSLPEVGADAAWYIDPLDVRGLAAAIRRHMPKENAATAPFIPALEQASRFSWSDAAQRTQDVLRRAAAAVPVRTEDGNRCWSMA
jgi:glycosyltransferase involved in cell wall biosynthesis